MEKPFSQIGNRVNEVFGSNKYQLCNQYAYLVDFRDSGSQKLLFELLENNILVKTATKPFSVKTESGKRDFSYGSLLISVSNQSINSSELHDILQKSGQKAKVDVIPVNTGFNVEGVDLGSSSFKNVVKPKVLVITG